MQRAFLNVLAVASLAPLLTAGAALVGLGVVRSLPAGTIAVTASLLVMLPAMGLWAALGRSQSAMVVAVWTWPMLLLFGLPSYFPGELRDAISTGYAVLAAPGGTSLALEAGRFGSRIAAPVGGLPQGTAPPPVARPATEAVKPPSVITSGDQVALPYEGRGQSLAIPVQMGESEFQMLFDTGATLTTLNAASLRTLGIRVPPDAPTVTLRTANGQRSARLVLVPDLWVGGFPVSGVTVGVCEECADADVKGLLGLNVSGQFLVTLDTARREVILQPNGRQTDRLLDIGPWLDVNAHATIHADERVEVTVEAVNASSRTVRLAHIGVACGEQKYIVDVRDIPAHDSRSEVSSLPRGTVCDVYKVSIEGAEW